MMEILNNFHFIRPIWLLAALPVIPALWLLWRRWHTGKAWSSVIAPELLPHLLSGAGPVHRSRWPLLILLAAWLLAVVALAGPSWERLPQPVEQRANALVVLFDLSASMYAADMTPSRLVRSRQKLLDLLEKKTEGTTALVAYAGDAHVVSPLTDDLRTVANLLPALSPDMMPVPGSRPAPAVELAVRLLRDAGQERGQILLLTDGIYPGDGDAIGKILAGTPYRLSVLGVGTEEGSPIPTGNGFLRDDSGNIVVASLDRAPLRRLARRFDGVYSDLELGDRDIERILTADLWNDETTGELAGRSVDTWADMGHWLALLLVPVALGAFRRGWLLCLVLLPLADPAQAQDWRDWFRNDDQRGRVLLEAGEAEAAAEAFDDPEWEAAAHYRAGNYEQALERYRAGNSADHWYNRGNSLARAGELQAAIDAYKKALEKAPEMEDAAFNKALLEQLLQQQQDQQGQNQNQQNQQGENQQQQNQQQENQQQQSADQQRGDQQQQAQQSPSQQQEQQSRQREQEQQGTGGDQREQQQQREAEQRRAQREEQSDSGEEAGEQQAAAPRDDDELEREMANEQWLRRIPDDPSGLLRRKFSYESRQRAQDNPGKVRENDEDRW